MARSLNRVTLLGHLGADAETKHTAAGVAVSNFNLATERRWKDGKSNEYKTETEWHRIVFWRSENVSTHLTRGKQVLIEGRLQTRKYQGKGGEDRYVTEIVVENLILLGGGAAGAQPVAAPVADHGFAGSTDPSVNDDIPF